MEKPRKRANHRNFEDKPEYAEANNEASMTIQGDASSIQEIMIKYAQGLELPRRPSEYLDADFNNPEAFRSPEVDLTDIHVYKNRMEEYKALVDEYESAKTQEEPKP